jgi:hypothetical protein
MVDDYTLWLREQAKLHPEDYPPPPPTHDEKIAALRAELDGLRGRLRDELLAELRVEVERAIAMSAPR